MAAETVRIDELVLRVPGMGKEEAQRLGQEVAGLVTDRLPAQGRLQRLRTLDVRVMTPAGTPPRNLAKFIAKIILEKLA